MTIPLVAVMMVVFLLLATLVVDLGVAYTARTSAQHAADASALAGAYTLQNSPALSVDDLIAAVTQDAAGVANASKVLNYPVTVSNAPQADGTNACDTGSNIVCVDTAKHRVTTVVAAPVDTYFGKITSWNLLNVKVKAVAEAALNATGDRCIKPFYLSNDVISPLPLPDCKGMSVSACNALWVNRCNNALSGGTTILDSSGNPTDWAKSYITAQQSFTSDINDYTVCSAGVSKGTSTGVGQAGCPIPFYLKNVNPSQYGLVDFTAGQGNGGPTGPFLTCAISNCLQECASNFPVYKCGDPITGLKTGGSVGQVVTPLQNLIGQNGSTPSNYYLTPTTFSNSNVTQNTSPSLISVIVWDCTHPVDNGTTSDVTIPPLGIAKIFVNKVDKAPNSDVFLISASACDATQGGGTGGPVTTPIRLVYTGTN